MAARQSLQTLKFSQSLRSSSNSDLAKRLKTLHTELRDYDQDLIDPTSLDKVARELIHTSLLLHKDKAVKAFAACCLVDILRLYAPEAPYTQAELRVSCISLYERELASNAFLSQLLGSLLLPRRSVQESRRSRRPTSIRILLHRRLPRFRQIHRPRLRSRIGFRRISSSNLRNRFGFDQTQLSQERRNRSFRHPPLDHRRTPFLTSYRYSISTFAFSTSRNQKSSS